MKFKVLLIAFLLLPLIFKINAENPKYIFLEIEFNMPTIEKVGEVYRIKIEGLENSKVAGMPSLPVKPLKILLPQKGRVKAIDVDGEKIFIGNYEIEIASYPLPMSKLNESIEVERKYHKNLYERVGIYCFRGYSILILNLYPIEYDNGKVYFYKKIRVKIEVDEKGSINRLFRGIKEDENLVKRIVENPEMAKSYTKIPSHGRGICNPDERYEYVVITSQEMKNYNGNYSLQDLINSKIAKGINATIVCVEEIVNESSYWNTTNPMFNDTQAKIRNFIRDAYLNWKTNYILLAGDGDDENDTIPPRFLYANASGSPAFDYEAYIPSDLYYACLDGNWNEDMDDRWGENENGNANGVDEADLYAEVYVGRACIDAYDELENFVMKTLSYEASNDAYLNKVLMVGEYLGFGGVADYGGNCKDEIIDNASSNGYNTTGIPSSIYDIDTLYDRDLNGSHWQRAEIMARINEGIHIINHLGHGNKYYAMRMYVSNIDALSNDKYVFIYSQTCLAGGFDGGDCAAEHFTVETPHGAFACIMNARYGWGEYNSTDGPSQRYDREFWDAVFGEGIREIGKANQDSKEDNIWRIDENCMRWCYYELNLFGDPEIAIKIPLPVTVYVSPAFNSSTPGWNYTHFNNIQDGINSVATNGTVYVLNGTYYENVVVNKSIRLIGNESTIDGKGNICILVYGKALISNFSLKNASCGIYCNSSDSIIKNIVSYECDIGILLEACHNITIINATTHNNTYDGIAIEYCNKAFIKECSSFWNGEGGISLFKSANTSIEKNMVKINSYGIGIWNASFNSICNNIAFGNEYEGIVLWNSSYNVIYNNTAYSNEWGIENGFSHYSEIFNNSIENNSYGIEIDNSSCVAVYGNVIKYCIDYGIELVNSCNNSVENNTICFSLHNGMDLWYNSSYNIIKNNTIFSCNNSIELGYSNYNSILNCGIYGSNVGILIWRSNENIIKECHILNNTYGIQISESSGNLIYNNYFKNSINAYDDSYNTWNISKTYGKNIVGGNYIAGNYWHDYAGIDLNEDGIGDTLLPYNCNESIVHGGDYLPLLMPNSPPIANFNYTPENPSIRDVIQFYDLSYDIDGYIVNYTWNFGDGNTSYERNTSHKYSKAGIYNVSLTVMDNRGKSNTTMKEIEVVEPRIDYIAITFKDKNLIGNENISCNFTFIVYASSFNYTYGFLELINASWNVLNNGSNASINASYGKSIKFNSGWRDGTAILSINYNNLNYSTYFKINSSLFSFMLYRGWNFITLPYENNYNASTLYSSIQNCKIILKWNVSEQDFIIYVPNSPYNFEIENGMGYLIGISGYDIFSLPKIPINSVSIALYVGWNCLGWFNESKPASYVYGSINGSIILLKWNISKGDFDVYINGCPYDFEIRRGEGFFIAVSEQSVWHGK